MSVGPGATGLVANMANVGSRTSCGAFKDFLVADITFSRPSADAEPPSPPLKMLDAYLTFINHLEPGPALNMHSTHIC